jgi:hypothetical protein
VGVGKESVSPSREKAEKVVFDHSQAFGEVREGVHCPED